MAQDEILPFEKPDETPPGDALSLIRKYAIGQIQKGTRDAMKPSRIDESEGALPEASPPPKGGGPENPFQDPYEYKEEEA